MFLTSSLLLQVAMDPKVSADTRLSYVTTGVFLEKLVNAKSMDKFTHVIIDEVKNFDNVRNICNTNKFEKCLSFT